MGQQEYEAFKAKLREWMNTHPDEYAAFEEAMNARDYAGASRSYSKPCPLSPGTGASCPTKPMKDCSSMSMKSSRQPTTRPCRQDHPGVRTARQGFDPSGDALLALLRQEFRTDGGAL